MKILRILFDATSPARRWFFGWVPFWVASYVVVQGAFLTPEDIPGWFIQLNDKVVHGMEYAVLFLAALNAFYRAVAGWLRTHAVVNALIYCAAVGAVTEWLQRFVPERRAEFADWFADIGGACLGWLFWKALQRMRPAGDRLKTGTVA